MASLQKYKGKGKNKNKTYYKTQVYLKSGKRVTIRLGSMSQKAAQETVGHVGHLVEANKHGVAIRESTLAWLRTANPSLVKTLSKYGLASLASDPTFEEWYADYSKDLSRKTKPDTQRKHENAVRYFREFFGTDVKISQIKPADALKFNSWLHGLEHLNENTANRLVGFIRQFFNRAVEAEVISKNPFQLDAITVTVKAAEKEYIPAATIDKVIAVCPTLEWKLLFAFARFVGCRMPSEIRNLKWTDINWEKNYIRIESPKTARKGKPERLVPIFSRVSRLLRELESQRDKSSDFVFKTLRHQTNPGVVGKKIAKKAEVKLWKKFFNSLRASCETDFVDQHGMRRACQWIGNTIAVAEKNYLLVKGTDFVEAGDRESDDFTFVQSDNSQSGANSGAVDASPELSEEDDEKESDGKHE
jgi:integrase